MNPVAAFDRLNRAAQVEDSMAEVRAAANADAQRLFQNIAAIAAEQRARDFSVAQARESQDAQMDRAILNEGGEAERAAARNAIETQRFEYQKEHDRVAQGNTLVQRAVGLGNSEAAKSFLAAQGREDLADEVVSAIEARRGESGWKSAVEAAKVAATASSASALRQHPGFQKFGDESTVAALEVAGRVAEEKRRRQAALDNSLIDRRNAPPKPPAPPRGISEAEVRQNQAAIIRYQRQLSELEDGDPMAEELRSAIERSRGVIQQYEAQKQAGAVDRLRKALGLGGSK